MADDRCSVKGNVASLDRKDGRGGDVFGSNGSYADGLSQQGPSEDLGRGACLRRQLSSGTSASRPASARLAVLVRTDTRDWMKKDDDDLLSMIPLEEEDYGRNNFLVFSRDSLYSHAGNAGDEV